MKSGSAQSRATSRNVPLPGRPSVFGTFGCQSSFAPCAASFAFSPGWSRHEVERARAVEAHLRALVDADDAARLAVESRRVLRASAARRDVVDVVDPAAAREDVGTCLLVVRLPESARIGRDREAADADLVPHDPRREHERGDAERERGGSQVQPRRRQSTYAREHERDEQRRTFPRIISPSTPPSSAPQRRPPRSATTSASSTAATARKWSRISRFMWTSCQTRYGCNVVSSAATRPTLLSTTRRPTS